jgi:polar amino acid transport system ATP-binding protein
MLKVTGLKKKFGNKEVLKNINLEINAGETVVIVGPSGGGKTTLLRCINALEYCDEGSIEINSKSLCDNGVYKKKQELKNIRKDIGLVFQSFNLFPHMSVIENIIEAPKRALSLSDKESRNSAAEILRFLDLGDKLNNYPCELSGGQKQRVAIGRALALNPKLMCFDEPTSALDPALTGEVAKLIKNVAEKGMTILIITHDMGFAEEVADKIYSMQNGILTEGNTFSIKN